MHNWYSRAWCAIALVSAVLPVGAMPCAASSYTVLHSFCHNSGCPDGSSPQQALVSDAAGNLFGVTRYDGRDGGGTIFEVSSGGAFSVLYNLCVETDCASFSYVPQLIVDTQGNLYGTASTGDGVVFELVRSGGRNRFRALYSFCQIAPCSDGSFPVGGLTYAGAASGAPYDGVSPLYGVTHLGGTDYQGYGSGTVYQLSPPAAGQSTWTEKVLYNFCAADSACSDGRNPQTLTADSGGKLYGVADAGDDGRVKIFKVASSHQNWTYTVLHHLNADFSEGKGPASPIAIDSSGSLFGTFRYGGPSDKGVLFRFRNGNYSVLYKFCNADCAAGAWPSGPVAIDGAGDIFGATYMGNGTQAPYGAIYEYQPQTGAKPLHNFKPSTGANPLGGLVWDNAGHLVGTAQNGGRFAKGAVFSFTP